MNRGMNAVVADFQQATAMAREAGFDLIEVHMAHAICSRASCPPLTNQRTDQYGGSLANRLRFPLRVVKAVRAVWPDEKPLSVRLSAVDWWPGGNEPEDAVEIARALKTVGCDIVDVSAGQTVPYQQPRYGRQFQTPFADRIRHEAGLATMAVGNISSFEDVNSIIASGRADLCLMARAPSLGSVLDPARGLRPRIPPAPGLRSTAHWMITRHDSATEPEGLLRARDRLGLLRRSQASALTRRGGPAMAGHLPGFSSLLQCQDSPA